MIYRNDKKGWRLRNKDYGPFILIPFIFWLLLFSSCGIYTFKDVSIPPEVKTIKIGFIENRARYKNVLLSPSLTDALVQKISNQTRLTRVNTDNADYQLSGYISRYDVSTSGITSQQAATNRLTVGVHIDLFKALKDTTEKIDVSRDFDFSANLTLSQAEGQLKDEIIKNLTDEIFNKVFSNW